MRYWSYLLISTALFGAMILESMLMYPNYFSALVGIPDSAVKACIVINFAGCLAVLWFKFVVFLFLGNLNSHELQSVYQRGWIFFCNSLLFWGTASIDSQVNSYNLGIGILAGLTLLVLHWICRSRVRALQAFDTSNVSARSIFKTARLAALCTILALIDIALCQISLEKLRKNDFSPYFTVFTVDLTEMCIVFCGELAVNAFAIYHLCNHEDDDEWERATLLTRIVHMLSSVVGMSAHFAIILGFGIWKSDFGSIIMRTIRCYRNVTGLWKVITAKSELDKFTTPAGEEELERDNTCVICRDEMFAADAGHQRKAAKKLGCGHIMHSGCLGSWLSRSQNCPTCRQPVQTAASSFKNDGGSPRENDTNNNNTENSPTSNNNAIDQAVEGDAHRDRNAFAGLGSDNHVALEPHVSREIESVLNRARERIRQQHSAHSSLFESPISPAVSTGTRSHTPSEDRRPANPLTVQMTGENKGLLAERYQFTFTNID